MRRQRGRRRKWCEHERDAHDTGERTRETHAARRRRGAATGRAGWSGRAGEAPGGHATTRTIARRRQASSRGGMRMHSRRSDSGYDRARRANAARKRHGCATRRTGRERGAGGAWAEHATQRTGERDEGMGRVWRRDRRGRNERRHSGCRRGSGRARARGSSGAATTGGGTETRELHRDGGMRARQYRRSADACDRCGRHDGYNNNNNEYTDGPNSETYAARATHRTHNLPALIIQIQ